jgi:hypothetical protein
MNQSSDSHSQIDDDSIDFGELFSRIRRGLVLTLGLTLIGMAVGISLSLITAQKSSAVTTLRATFGFPGFERGTYPNGSKFQSDDIRAPDVVNEAIARLKIDGMSAQISSQIRGAIGVSGIVSPAIIKERDKLRAAGQTVPDYYPDEYEISLSLHRDFTLSIRQRELLLTEIVSVYREKFRRAYVELPQQFDNPFNSLKDADFVEYELILTKEIQSLSGFIKQQELMAKQFRSSTNNLSFKNLHTQVQLFTQVRLNSVLSLIYINGMSIDREYAIVKMEYFLRTLEDQEKRLLQEESVVTSLLEKTQDRSQNYVLATKTQQPQSAQPIIDQGFIDTLLSNDAYNFLVRKALDAGLAAKRVQSEIDQVKERRTRMESFSKGAAKDQAVAIVQVTTALQNLNKIYQDLLVKIRIVMDDYSKQEYANAVRITLQPKTSSLLMSLIFGAGVGFAIGASLGLGLSLIKPSPHIPAA